MFNIESIQDYVTPSEKLYGSCSGSHFQTLIEVDEMDRALDLKNEHPYLFDGSLNKQKALQVMQANVHHYLSDRFLFDFKVLCPEILEVFLHTGIIPNEHGSTATYIKPNTHHSLPVYSVAYADGSNESMMLIRGRHYYHENISNFFGAATMVDCQSSLKDFLTQPYCELTEYNPNRWDRFDMRQSHHSK